MKFSDILCEIGPRSQREIPEDRTELLLLSSDLLQRENRIIIYLCCY